MASEECRRLRDNSSAIEKPIQATVGPVVEARASLVVEKNDSEVIGRQPEVRQIRDHLSEGRPVLVAGAFGVGKTTVVGEAIRQFLGSAPCEAVHRFEFANYRADASTRDLAADWESGWKHCSRFPAGTSSYLGRRKLLLVFEDVHHAPRTVIQSLLTLVGRLVDEEPQVRLLMTCRTPTDAASSWIRESTSHVKFGDVHLSRLLDREIRSILLNSFFGSDRLWDDRGLRQAVWLSSGSPGYCRDLLTRLMASESRAAASEAEVARAGLELLQDSPSGVATRTIYDALSKGAQSIALWSCLRDTSEAIDRSSLPRFYEQAILQSGVRFPELPDAIAEAKSNGIIDSFELGETPVVRLNDESHRPHLKLLAWQQLGESVRPELALAGSSG